MTNPSCATISVRSYLTAGLAAATVGALATVPVTASGPAAVSLSSIALSAAVRPLVQPVAPVAGTVLGAAAAQAGAAGQPGAAATAAAPTAAASGGDAIINAYNAIEPWVQWGFEVGAWAVSYLPWPVGYLGQQINIGYSAGEPIVQAFVYSFAYLIDGQFDLIGPTLVNGFQTSFNNFVQGEINWFLSFFPPLPPINFPVFPGAAVAAPRTASAVTPTATANERPADEASAATGDPAGADEGAGPTEGAGAVEGAGPTEGAGPDTADSGNPAPADEDAGTTGGSSATAETEATAHTAQSLESAAEPPADEPTTEQALTLEEEPTAPNRTGTPNRVAQTSASGASSADQRAGGDAASAGSGRAGGSQKSGRPGRASRSAN